MRSLNILNIIAAFFILTSTLFSQGGSNYSIFGIGDRQISYGAYYDGLAGTSIAMPAENAVGFNNPALWSKVTSTRLQAGYKFNQHYISTEVSDIFQNNGKVNGIYALFSIDTSRGISACLGIVPYSSVNYFIASPVKVSIEDLTLEGVTSYKGTGGINTVFFGASFNLLDNLSLGGSIYGDFGKSSSVSVTAFSSSSYYSSKNLVEDSYSGLGFKGGIFYNLFKDFSIGAVYEKNGTVSVNRETIYGSDLLADSSQTCSFDTRLPDSYGFGISYKTGKFMIGADYSSQDFSTFDYKKGVASSFRQSNAFSLGLVRMGNSSYSAPYLDKVTYRLGVGYHQLYYKVNNQDVNEIFGSFGVTLPLPGTALLDAAVSLGKRGRAADGLSGDMFGRFSVDISIGETWFKPFKREW